MHIEEAEDLRLGKSEGVPDGAGLQRRVLGQLDHHLHAQRPLALRVSRRHSDSPVERLAHRAHRPVAHHGQRRVDIHPGHESIRRRARAIDPLIGQPNPFDGVSLLARVAREDRRAHRRSRPYLHQAGGHQLRSDPLVELAHGEHQPAVLVQKSRRPGQLERRILHAQQPAQPAQQNASPARSANDRRLAPMGSSRYSTRSSLTGVAMGISAGSSSGKLARMPLALVTMPLTPAAISSARS